MIALDKNAFICDMAETYQIYDYRRVPVELLGILAAGLRDDSRIMQKLNGVRGSDTEMLLAGILDALHTLVWFRTKDGQRGRNRPDSIAEKMLVKEEKQKEELVFDTPEAFDKERERLLKEIKDAESR